MTSINLLILSTFGIVVKVINALIFLRIILSWIMPMKNEFTELLYRITEPLLKPFRMIIPIGGMGGLDLSPLILIFVLNFLQKILYSLLSY